MGRSFVGWRRLSLVLAAFVLALFPLAGPACASGKYSGPVESITLGTVLLEPSTLIFVAEEQKLFARNGLDVAVQYYETGLAATNAMLDGKVDIAAPATEFVLVGKVFNKENIQAIATIDKVDYAAVIGRKDRGIGRPADLAGKKIGVSRGTILEFRLGRFLELNGVRMTDVEIVNIALGRAADAIASGEIDAAVTIPPYTEASKAKLGNNWVMWPAQGGQFSYQLLIGKTEWLSRNPKTIERFLKALKLAEDFVIKNPAEVNDLLQRRLNITDSDIARIWEQNQFGLSLDQSLITAMEDQARWMIANNLTTEKQVPNFTAYIYEDALEAVKPEAVNIIR